MKCPFFKVCAAYIIEQRLGDKDYPNRFCDGSFKDCEYYEYRKTSKEYKEFVKQGLIGPR